MTVRPPPRMAPIALKDEQLDHLFEAAVSARRRYIATGLADALKSADPIEGATVGELAEVDAAETASLAADKSLADYRAGKLEPSSRSASAFTNEASAFTNEASAFTNEDW